MNDFVSNFEVLFEVIYGHRADVEVAFNFDLKRNLFFQNFMHNWLKKELT